MKPSHFILAATLLCNAALIALALLKPPAPELPRRGSANPKSRIENRKSYHPRPTLRQRRHPRPPRTPPRNGLPPRHPPQRCLRANRKKYAARRAALEAPPLPYWRERSKIPQPKPDRAARRDEKLALDNEMNADFKNLTAGLVPDEPRNPALRRAYGDLPDAKIAQIAAINRDYGDMRAQLYEDMNAVRLPGDQAQLDLIDKEQRADLAQALTPDELRDYDLRSSPLAKNLQHQIKYFNSTEAEYTALYDAQTVINEKTAGQKLSDAELSQLLDAAAKDILAPARYEEYKIATTPAYEDVYNMAGQLNLPQTAVAQIITIQNTITAQAAQIRNDTTLAPADRDTRLAALAQTARNQLTTILDEKGMKYYQQRPASNWVLQLQPKQPGQAAR